MKFAHLKNRVLIRICGTDAEHFLENIVTCKIEGMEAGDSRFGALLTPQGKILFDFFVYYDGSAYLFDIEQSLAADFTKRMMFYRLRASVEIDEVSANIYAIWEGDLPQSYQDPRMDKMGSRLIAQTEPEGEASDYELHRISNGVPAGGQDFFYGDAYPHEVLMDQYGGVDFRKGCYVGQEIVSRMQHRGTTKKRVIFIQADTDLPQPGSDITADGKPVGKVGSTAGKLGLALVRLDRVARANDLLSGDINIVAKIQDWVDFDLPGKKETVDHAE